MRCGRAIAARRRRPTSSAQIREAVADIVRRQAQAGVTVVNDGEAGKIGYSTYVKERLDGFGGSGGMGGVPTDLTEYPGYLERVLGEGIDFAMPTCVGPVSYRDHDAVRSDIANLKAAVDGTGVKDAFMTAASPGVISFFLTNRHYPSHEDYIAALADAMKTEYDEIHRAGLVLQLDCPDLAMTHHMTPGESLDDFRRRAALHVEALNHATRDIPADEMRLHLCWGNYEGPHHHDVPLERHHRRRPARRGLRRSRSRRRTRATSTSGPCSTTSSCPTARR